jgi:hypothetical protein
MINYDLDFDEVVIQEFRMATLVNNKMFATSSGPLVLTNHSIIFYELNFIGKVKRKIKYPLNTIKTYNNQAQVKYDVYTIIIYTQTETIGFRVGDYKSECYKFINNINKILFGDDAIEIKEKSPGLEAISNAFSSIKASLGFDTDKSKEKIVVKCEGCGSDFSGLKSTVVKCPYCGRPKKLE